MKRKQEHQLHHGDGKIWSRGSLIGKGGFGSVYLATLKKPRSPYSYLPPTMAVKSAEVSVSGSLQKEKEVLSNLQGCPYILRCFSEETTTGENGDMVYNLLLEYASGGTLADHIEKSNGSGLPESEVRRYTRSILRGLKHIHDSSYVHCDLKPDNVLLVPTSAKNFVAKIGDFGLAKRAASQSKKRRLDPYWRGTPLYLPPEVVIENVQEPPSDIWALGCVVLEMLTGKLPWDRKPDLGCEELLFQISNERELPKISSGISKEGKDFLNGCLVRKAKNRLTAEMLLNHPFVAGLDEEDGVINEFEEVSGASLPSSMSEDDDDDDDDDDLSCSYCSDDWSFASDEGSPSSSWSTEAGEINSAMEVQKKGGIAYTDIIPQDDHIVNMSRLASSKPTQQYPSTLTIRAGA